MWRFKFPNYISSHTVVVDAMQYTVTKKLGAFSYWLIRWFHGEQKLIQMSAEKYLEKEFFK